MNEMRQELQVHLKGEAPRCAKAAQQVLYSNKLPGIMAGVREVCFWDFDIFIGVCVCL